VKTKKFAGAAAVGTVTAVTTLLLGATPALAQEDSASDSAYALSASGILDINPISFVESADGTLVHDELLSIGDVAGPVEDDISVGLLTSEAESNRAETVVKEVNLLDILRADLIRTWCDNGEGGLQIVNGTVLGQKLPDTSVPSKELDVSPLVKVSLNDQKRNTDGSLSVTGIELTVLPAPAVAKQDEKLSAQEKAALPLVGDLLGTKLDSSAGTVGDVVGQLGGTLALDGDLQKITIGNATCQEGGAASGASDSADDGDNGSGNGGSGSGSDDGDNGSGSGGDDDGDASGNGDDSDVKSATPAPAPSVVQAALPVTG
jgi:hypothetical protein